MRISLEQALDILMDHVTQGRTERKPLEQCLGLVLSQDVFALLDMPPFSRSARRTLHRSLTYKARHSSDSGRNPYTDSALLYQLKYHAAPRQPGT